MEEEEGWGRERDAQGKVLQAKFAWAGSIVKGVSAECPRRREQDSGSIVARRECRNIVAIT